MPAAAEGAAGPTPEALLAENAALKAELAALRQTLALDGSRAAAAEPTEWPTTLDYDKQAGHSPLAQIAGVSKERMKQGLIRNSDEFEYLPKPTADAA